MIPGSSGVFLIFFPVDISTRSAAPAPVDGPSDRFADFTLAGLEASIAVLRHDYEVDSVKLRTKVAQNQAMKEKLDEAIAALESCRAEDAE